MSEPHLRLVEDRPPSLPPPDPLVGRTLDGRYRIEEVLGEGGMGIVYRARHAVLNKPLAIKVLRPEVSRDVEVMSRFQQEAQSASAIGNHHIIDISDFGSLPDGSTYFVMEFLDGISLTKAIEEQHPLPAARVVKIAKQLCDALGAAHERSIVHRDLKPDNIYLIKRGSESDFVKVLDFGIAKVGGASSKLTKAGQVFGTPHYMSPEQCAGANVDARTDIYAIGVILYEMSSGRVPFDADNLMGILTKHMYEQPIPPRELPPPVDVPPGLEAVILKCLAKSPDARYQSMAEMRADLERIEAGLTPQAVVDAVDRASGAARSDITGRVGREAGIRFGSGEMPNETSKRGPVFAAIGLGAVLVLAGGGYLAFAAGSRTDSGTHRVEGGASAAGSAGAASVSSSGTDRTSSPAGMEAPEQRSGVESQGAGGDSTGGAAASDRASGTASERPGPISTAPVRIESEPPGAEVLVNGLVLGVTPLEVPRPAQGSVTAVTLRMRGFREENLGVTEFSPATLRRTLARATGPLARGRDPGTTAMLDVATETSSMSGSDTARMTEGRSSDGLVDPWQ